MHCRARSSMLQVLCSACTPGIWGACGVHLPGGLGGIGLLCKPLWACMLSCFCVIS